MALAGPRGKVRTSGSLCSRDSVINQLPPRCNAATVRAIGRSWKATEANQ